MVLTRSQTTTLSSDSPPPGSAPSCSCPPPPDWSVVKCCVCQMFPRLLDNNNQVPCCPNGHITCSICAPLLESTTCPACRSPLEFTCPGSMISRLLESCDHPVHCQYSCGHQGSLVEVTRHEEVCTKAIEMCSNQGCEEMILHRDMRRHKMSCPYGPIQCFVCELFFSPLTWSTDHPACFKTLDEIREEERGQMLLAEGRVTVFINGTSFRVFGRLDDGEEDKRVRISWSLRLEREEIAAFLLINKWADWKERVWYGFPFAPGAILGICLE